VLKEFKREGLETGLATKVVVTSRGLLKYPGRPVDLDFLRSNFLLSIPLGDVKILPLER